MSSTVPSVLTDRERKLVLPLARDIIEDGSLYGVLADLVRDNWQWLATGLDRGSLWYLVEALQLGCWRARKRAQRCRGAIRSAVNWLVRERQNDGGSGVEIDILSGGTFWISQAELQGFPWHPAVWNEQDRVDQLTVEACSRAHCERLVRAVLDNEPCVLELAERVPLLFCDVREAIMSVSN